MSHNADHSQLGSQVIQSGEIAAISQKFAEGFARIRDVTDHDGACPAWAKALYMASAAAVRDQFALMNREMGRACELGLLLDDARGAALAVLISRGEGVYATFSGAIDAAYGEQIGEPEGEAPDFELDRQGCLDYFAEYFGSVPDYVELMAEEAPRALEGYVLMRQWSLAENKLASKHVNCCSAPSTPPSSHRASSTFTPTAPATPAPAKPRSWRR